MRKVWAGLATLALTLGLGVMTAESASASATEPTFTSANTTPDKLVFSSEKSISTTLTVEVDEPSGWKLDAARFEVCNNNARNTPCDNWSERWFKIESNKLVLQRRVLEFKGSVPDVDSYTGQLVRWGASTRVTLSYTSPAGDSRTFAYSPYISALGATKMSLSGPSKITPGRSLTLTGKASCFGRDSYGPPPPGPYGPTAYANVEFQREGSSTWQYMGSATVGADGTFEYFNLAVGASGNWRANYWDYAMCENKTSNTVHVEAKDGGTPPVAPKVPNAPGAKVIKTSWNTVTVDWSKPSKPNGDIAGYRWGWTSSNGKPQKTWSYVFPSTPDPFVLTNLWPHTKYTVWVEAINNNGTGARKTFTVTTASAPKAPSLRGYHTCTDLNKVYKHGVGKRGATDKTSGTQVRNFYVNNALYAMNDGRVKSKGQYDLDRDNDGIACEKR